MTERPQPYVGVSGVVCEKKKHLSGLVVTEPQQMFIESHANRAGLFETGRALALGVKATHKVQYLDQPNKHGSEWYPVGKQEFAEALKPSKNPNVFGVAQTYLDLRSVGDSEYRREFTDRIAERGKAWLQAVQFDMLPWHENDEMFDFLGEFRDRYPELKIILQAHERAMDKFGPKGLAEKLGVHAAVLDYVIFDESHGTGKRLNTEALDSFLDASYSEQKLDTVNFAVAGGLDHASVRENLPGLLAKYPELSWDAEGRLHPLNNAGKRPLQMDEVQKYFKASVDVLTA